MRLDSTGAITTVALSERNLLSLLHKLRNIEDSYCTLTYRMEDGTLLTVTAEPDDVHYNHPERDLKSPGPMHPREEAFLMHKECGATDPTGYCTLPFGHLGKCDMTPES